MTIRTYQYRVQAVVVGGTVISESITDNLNLDSFVGPAASVSDTLSFVEFATFFILPGNGLNIVQELGLTEEVTIFGYEQVEDTLGVTDAASETHPTSESKVDNLLLQEEVIFSYGVRNFIVEDVVGITDSLAQAIPLNITDVLGVTDDVSRFTFRITDANVVTDLAEWGYGKDASNDLGLTHLAEKTQRLRKAMSDTSIVSHSVAWFVESPCAKLQFKTFHGSGGIEPQSAKLNYKSPFLFQSLVDGTIVQLRSPETDDRRRISFNRTNRNFFDGSLDLFADPSWITEERQLYTIVSTKRADLDTLFTFLSDNLGLEIILKDWRGVTWVVVVTNPGEVYTEDGDGRWTLDFEVAGTAIDGEWAFQPLPITDDASRAGSVYRRAGSDTVSLLDSVGRNYDEAVPTDDVGLSDIATFTIV